MISGQCDACGATNRILRKGYYCGIETYACAQCFGFDADTFDEDESEQPANDHSERDGERAQEQMDE